MKSKFKLIITTATIIIAYSNRNYAQQKKTVNNLDTFFNAQLVLS